MSDPKPTAARKPAAASSSQRTVVIVVVVLLIVVAIAGIVLARKGTDAPVAATEPASAPPVASASTPGAASAPTGPPPNELVFAAGSDKMPAGAADIVSRFVEKAKIEGKIVRISARFLTGANKAKDFELSKARTTAVRHAVSADGVTGDKIQMELIEMPAGSLADKDANRIVLSLQ